MPEYPARNVPKGHFVALCHFGTLRGLPWPWFYHPAHQFLVKCDTEVSLNLGFVVGLRHLGIGLSLLGSRDLGSEVEIWLGVYQILYQARLTH